MTVHVLHGGDGYAYLTRQVAAHDNTMAVGSPTRLTDYYSMSGEPPGQWVGRGCESLGVSGEVREEQMARLFGEGLHPDADLRPGLDNQLGRKAPRYRKAPAKDGLRIEQRQAVAGLDLVFSPCKSISTLWAVGGREAREQIGEAHEEAWREVVGWLEDEVTFTRTGAGGLAQIETRGLVATAFEHRTSRAGDPDLHTHVAVANRVQGLDGKWRTLDARVLHSAGVTASEMYNARVEDAVSRRLGVTFAGVERPDGKRPVREIVGVPAELTRAFSQRRAAIEDRLRELLVEYRVKHGRSPSASVQIELAQDATLETREAKGPHRPLAERVPEWRATAERVLGPGGLQAAMAAADRTPLLDERTPAEVADQVLAVVSGERSTFNRWHVRAEIERQLAGRATADRTALVDQVEDLVVGAGGNAIRLTMDRNALPGELQRSDGASQFRVHGSARYTSRTVLDAEERLVAAGRREAEHAAPVPADMLVGLDAGQRALVEHFAGSGMVLSMATGAAGVGKTTAMRALARTWELAGGRVVAMTNAAAAAEVLGEEIGTRAQTIARVVTLARHGRLTADMVDAGDMLLVDEAGSAGTIELDELRGIAEDCGAVLRLVGDYRQSGAAAAGGALRLLAGELGGPELLEVHRFADPAEAAASLALRTGDAAAVEFYLAAGRVQECADIDAAAQTYAAWRADRAAGRAALMMAKSNAAVAELNARARVDRLAAGAGDTGPEVELRDDHRASAGDTVLTRRNDRTVLVGRRGDYVRNGELWTVRAVHSDGSMDVQRLSGQAVTTLPAAYVAGHLQLGYACTIDRAKGATVDVGRAVVEPGMTREDLYVAMTRGRQSNHAYIPTESHLDVDTEHAADAPTDARTVLRAILANEGAELSATETMREEMDAPGRLDTLAPEYAHAVDVLAGTTVVEPSGPAAGVAEAPLPWLPAVPAGPADEVREWTAERAEEIRARVEELVEQVDLSRPAWAQRLGQRPADPVPAREWDHAVQLAAAYREEWRVEDESTVLGPRPDGGFRETAWRAADEATRTVHPDRPYARLTDQQLTAEASAWWGRADDARRALNRAEEYLAGRAPDEPGPATVRAQEANRDLREHADQARQLAEAERGIQAAEAAVRAKVDELAAVSGPFSGRQRKAITAEVETLRREVVGRRAAAAELPRPSASRRKDEDLTPDQVAALADDRLARAEQEDASRLRSAQETARTAPSRLEQAEAALAEVEAEQRLRELDPVLSTMADPEELTREERELAHAELGLGYVPEPDPEPELGLDL